MACQRLRHRSYKAPPGIPPRLWIVQRRLALQVHARHSPSFRRALLVAADQGPDNAVVACGCAFDDRREEASAAASARDAASWRE
eukprot:scaffold4768_cov412-Prasinococcus_capsulatus_cf.AAC.30